MIEANRGRARLVYDPTMAIAATAFSLLATGSAGFALNLESPGLGHLFLPDSAVTWANAKDSPDVARPEA
jgi:hypothetical protein